METNTKTTLTDVSKGADMSLATFDAAGLLERVMGDRELAVCVLNAFEGDMPLQLQRLSGFMEAGSAKEIAAQAHQIRGASASVGGEAMRALALEVETAGKAGDLAAARDRMDHLTEQFVRLREAIARYRES